MSYRDRYNRTHGVSGYRSQPSSNRSSLYLSTDYNISDYSSDLLDFDRQFKKLLERTENFTSRVEKLQNTSSYIRKGFRRIDDTVTGIRSQRDIIENTFDNIGNRLNCDDAEEHQATTEGEWRGYLESSVLVEKAVELLRLRSRYPKPTFEYTPEDRSPYPYDISSNTSLVSNPDSPKDEDGNSISSLKNAINKERVDFRKLKDKKTLPIVSEIDEHSQSEIDEHSQSDKNTSSQISSHEKSNESIEQIQEFRSSKLFANIESENMTNKPYLVCDEVKSKNELEETLTRRPSFLRTLISNRKKNRPTSMYEKSSTMCTEIKNTKGNEKTAAEHPNNANKNGVDDTDVNKTDVNKADLNKTDVNKTDVNKINVNETADVKTASKRVGNNIQKSKVKPLDKTPLETSKASSKTKSLNVNIDRKKYDSDTNSLQRNRYANSSFHEYNPSNRIPIKERLRLKEEAESKQAAQITDVKTTSQNTSTNSFSATKDNDKEESLSLKSRFLRRFYSKNEKNGNEDITRRKKTRPREVHVDQSNAQGSGLLKEQNHRIEKPRSNKNTSIKKDEEISNDVNRLRLTPREGSFSKEENDETKFVVRKRRKSRPLLDEEESFDEPRRFSDITASLRDICKQANTSKKHENVEVSADQLQAQHLTLECINLSVKNDDATNSEKNPSASFFTSSQQKEAKDQHSIFNEFYSEQQVKQEEEFTTPVVLRCRHEQPVVDSSSVKLRSKTLSVENTNLKNLNRKSVLIFEEDIVPVQKTEEINFLDFPLHKKSSKTVSEEELKVSILRQKIMIPDNIFDVFTEKQQEVCEENIPIIRLFSKVALPEKHFIMLEQDISNENQETGRKDSNNMMKKKHSGNNFFCNLESEHTEDLTGATVQRVNDSFFKIESIDEKAEIDNTTIERTKRGSTYDEMCSPNVKSIGKSGRKEESIDSLSPLIFLNSQEKSKVFNQSAMKPRYGRPALPSLSNIDLTLSHHNESTMLGISNTMSNYNITNENDIPLAISRVSKTYSSDDKNSEIINVIDSKILDSSCNIKEELKDNEISTPRVKENKKESTKNHNSSLLQNMSPLSLSLDSKSFRNFSNIPIIDTPHGDDLRASQIKRTSLTNLARIQSLDSLSMPARKVTEDEKRVAQVNLFKAKETKSLTDLPELGINSNTDQEDINGELNRTRNDITEEVNLSFKNDFIDVLTISKNDYSRLNLEEKIAKNFPMDSTTEKISNRIEKDKLIHQDKFSPVTAECIKATKETDGEEIGLTSLHQVNNIKDVAEKTNKFFKDITSANDNNKDSFSRGSLETSNNVKTLRNIETIPIKNGRHKENTVDRLALTKTSSANDFKTDSKHHDRKSSVSYPTSRKKSSPSNELKSSKAKSDSEIKPNLEKQMSLKEYRRRKVELEEFKK